MIDRIGVVDSLRQSRGFEEFANGLLTKVADAVIATNGKGKLVIEIALEKNGDEAVVMNFSVKPTVPMPEHGSVIANVRQPAQREIPGTERPQLLRAEEMIGRAS